jgi:hypothetical protein
MLTEEEIGVFDERSAYQGNFDLFGFEGNNGTLVVHMLQDNKKVKVTYTASRCEVKNFDFCLEIKGSPRGPAKYYSRKGWEIDSTGEAIDLANKLAHE